MEKIMTPVLTSNIAGLKIPLADIESEFRKIWEHAGDKNDASMAFRASTLNLIVICNNKDHFNEILDMAPEITKSHPGRIILVLLDPDQETERISANISAFCHPHREDGRQICCELITLETGNDGAKHLSGTLLPLILSDLPVFLYSPDNLVLNSPHFEHLKKSIERVILNAPDIFDSLDSVYKYVDSVIKTSKYSKISDLEWSRLTPWREALARLFDGKEGKQKLTAVSGINIRTGGAGFSSTALFLAGWMASRLQWSVHKYENKENLDISLRTAGRKIHTRLYSGADNVPNGDISAIEIEFGADSDEMLTAKFKDGGINLLKLQNDQEQFLDKIATSTPSQTWLIGNELDFVRADTVYLASIETLWNALNTDKRNVYEVY